MRKYTSLSDLRIDQAQLFNDFETELQAFFIEQTEDLQKMYQQTATSSNHKDFEVILFYMPDLATLDIQTFVKDQSDAPEYWNYRGYVLPSILPNPVNTYDKKMEEALTPNFDDWLEWGDDAYPMSGSEHPALLEEWPLYVAEKIALWYGEQYDSDLYPWKCVYLDFLADRDFHQGQVYDLCNKVWTKLNK